MTRVSITECRTYEIDEVSKAVGQAVELLGGIDKFVEKGMRVLVKPNMLAPAAPAKAMLTHAAVIEAVCELVFEAGAIPVVGDNSSIGSAKWIAKKNGLTDYLDRRKVELIDLESSTEYKPSKAVNFKSLEVSADAVAADAIINLPKLKTHGMMMMTMAVKNMFGAIVGPRKGQWHLRAGADVRFFAGMLVELCYFLKPSLSILDAVVGMEANGPNAGTPREVGLIAASADPTALDRVMLEVVGLKPNQVYTIEAAKKLGFGEPDISKIEILGEKPEDYRIKDWKLPRTASTPRGHGKIDRLLRGPLTAKPVIGHTDCTRCKTCINHCPPEAMSLADSSDPRGEVLIDYDKCIRCFCCQELCPEETITIRDGWALRAMSAVRRK